LQQGLKAWIATHLNEVGVLRDSNQISYVLLLALLQPVQCILFIAQAGEFDRLLRVFCSRIEFTVSALMSLITACVSGGDQTSRRFAA
jgi:hypothetical protein